METPSLAARSGEACHHPNPKYTTQEVGFAVLARGPRPLRAASGQRRAYLIDEVVPQSVNARVNVSHRDWGNAVNHERLKQFIRDESCNSTR